MAQDYGKLVRTRNDSMTSNQSTLERRRIQTPRSTISQAGSEISLAESHTSARRVDPFGAAKPADVKDKYLEYEEKMRRDREAHFKKQEEEKKQRKESRTSDRRESYEERHMTPETANAPGQIKILQKEKRSSQSVDEPEKGGSVDSRRETQESQVFEPESKKVRKI